MLSTLIYRSRARVQPAVQELQMIERGARERNARSAITGILIYDGVHFVQLLEGPEDAVEQTYARISGDRRHHCVVKLLHDYAPRRKFDGWGMRVFDVREWERPQIQALMADLLHDSRMPRADRAYKLLQGFAAGNWQGQVIAEDFDPHAWTLDRRGGVSRAATDFSGAECRFALQPIVNTTSGTISSLEALLRSAEGGPPSAVLDGLSAPEIYLLDLETKRQAIALAAEVGISDCKLSINLIPSSLTVVPDAVERLVAYAKEHGISTEQLIVEVTENEAISHFDDFAIALKKLRGAGIGVAIDDFGSGFAGLAMLAKFQPEKLKIDREIVSGIESDAARQAIARAIVQCCDDLGITVVAEGVESLHEWNWLKHAGIELFQGYLFARPMLEGVAAVDWPTPVALP